ncbi:GTP 3',8-cyclase MoaA [Thermoproteota archaeon]
MLTILDTYGRPVTQARISLNSSMQCNFSCDFCHMEGIKETSGNLIQPLELERLCRMFTSFDIFKIKLTGGEPLLRKDIEEIVERVNASGVKEISLSTNGTNLVRLASKLKKKGLKRVNISLHTLNHERFKKLTGVDRLNETIEAIKAAIKTEFLPVKINTTVMRGINDDEIEELIEFSRELGGSDTNILQLIELVTTESRFYYKYHFPMKSIENELKKKSISSMERVSHKRPKYELPNKVIVEIVRPMHNTEFCMGCNRIRVTYDGKFKPCLLRGDNHIDFLTAMRTGADDADLADMFKKAISLREPFFKIE